MQTVSLDDVQQGMILAADLKQGNRMLLPAGSVLTNKNISVLKNQGIKSLQVVPAGVSDPDE